MKIKTINKNLKLFLAAKQKYDEVDDHYTDILNNLPRYIGSDFPNAMPPNKAQAILNKLEPELNAAQNEVNFAAKRLIADLVRKYHANDTSYL